MEYLQVVDVTHFAEANFDRLKLSAHTLIYIINIVSLISEF